MLVGPPTHGGEHVALIVLLGEQSHGVEHVALVELALIAEKAGHIEQSVRLLGAAATLPQRLAYRQTFDAITTTARIALGEPAFTAAWNAGTDLFWDEVIAEIDTLIQTLTDDAKACWPLSSMHGLSPRELDVLRLLAEGRSNRAIGDRLSISERTVENHVVHILAKLDFDSRTAAAAWAVRNGLA